jgi:hypothetical protein
MHEAVGRARELIDYHMEEEKKELEKVAEFVKANLVAITDENKQRRCVDGRYSDSDAEQAVVAVPGGDAGELVASFAALNKLNVQIDPAQVEQVILEAVGGPEHFNFHTDEHSEADHSGHGMGCGHLKLARNNLDDYGVTKEQMEFLFGELEHLAETGAHEVVLSGEHGEKMVLVIESDKWSVKPKFDSASGEETQAFIYQSNLDLEMIHKIAEGLHRLVTESGQDMELDVIKQSLIEASSNQRTQTLARLAPDLPKYQISFSESAEPIITKL